MKVIAMYLPQFHRVKENDEWWGEGFTEWTTLKQAQPLFEGHDQPRKPLNSNYYDLLDKKTMLWQTMLMKKYGVFGMCFYHYWFKDGKRILEKPAENLLTWKDVDMPFCFSWANESWVRTWSTMGQSNVWSSKFEKFYSEGDKAVLLEQSYEGEEEWKQHFYYLLPFFKDERYIKIDEKPVFIVYKPQKIYCMAKMREYWNELACENGFTGIYFIATNVVQKESFDAVLIQEPQMAIGNTKYTVNGNGLKMYDGQQLWDNILRYSINEENVFWGGTPGYDDTPRHENQGIVIKDMTPDMFCDGMKQLMLKSEMHGKNDIVFINAWNEWGEGMYLEPDERNGYKYLEAVKEALEAYRTEKPRYDYRKSVTLDKESERLRRYESYWRLLDDWMTVIDAGSNIGEYFKKNGIKTIAVYGMGMMGKHLVSQLKGSDVKIVYGIDRRPSSHSKYGFPVINVSERLEKVDAIIVAVTYDLHSIYTSLKEKIECPILFLGEIIDYLLMETK